MSPLLKTALFTVVVPGSVAVLVPLLVVGNRATAVGAARVLGLVLLALGAVVHLRSAWDFASFGRGTPAITDAPKRLVTRGFYRYTRNPMYVAVLSVIASWAVAVAPRSPGRLKRSGVGPSPSGWVSGAQPAYSLNKSEWVPVRTKCNSLPFTWWITSQSGSMCASR